MIVAGCGYTGARLARAERCDAREGTGVVGTAAGLRRLTDQGIPGVRWDLDGGDDAPDLDWQAPLVYLVPPPHAGDDDPRLQHCLAALPALPARVVYASTTGVYGNRDGAHVDETAVPCPQTPRAVRRLAAENRVRDWCEAHGVPWVVLRVPGIYGPHRLQRATIDSGRPMLRPQDAGPGNRIHVDDLVRCLQAAAGTAHADRVFNVGDGDPMSNTEFVALVAGQLGLSAPPQADRASVEAAAGARRRSFRGESRQVDCAAMRQVLGVVPRYAQPAAGIAASLAEMAAARPAD